MNHTHEHAHEHEHGLQHGGHARHGDDRQPLHERSGSVRHAGSDAPKGASGEIVYTCPMHPQIRQPGPGNCPICGMALEPLAPAASVENPRARSATS